MEATGEVADEKVRTNRLRRMAQRQGYDLHKSRRRDPYAKDHSVWRLVDTPTSIGSGLDPDRVEREGEVYRSLDAMERFLTRSLAPRRQRTAG